MRKIRFGLKYKQFKPDFLIFDRALYRRFISLFYFLCRSNLFYIQLSFA